MAPEHVAYGMRVSYGHPHVTPDHVIDWERGTTAPSNSELTALAGVLWCSPGELIGRPRTLREHRIARCLAPEDVARSRGARGPRVPAHGGDRHLARHGPPVRRPRRRARACACADFVTVTGRDAKLGELLRSAVTTRWQAYVRPVAKLVPLDRPFLEGALQALHEDYQGHMAATLSWGGGNSDAGDGARDFLDRIVEHFWTRIQEQPGLEHRRRRRRRPEHPATRTPDD